MASYGYGPPPPAPAPSQGPSQGGGYPHYPQPYPSSHHGGGHSNHHGQRGGRGGHQGGPHYAYNSQPASQPYGQPQAGSYPQQGPPANYPPQQWHHEQSHGHHTQHQQQPPQPSLQAHNYHPNYAPQMYQQQPYSQQPAYQQQQQQQQPYGQQQYSRPDNVPPAPQQWSGPAPQQNGHGPQFGGSGGRGGRGGHHNDRGGGKAQMMGPPIRIGFENGTSHAQDNTAPVSGGYYGPQGNPAPYPPGPYQGYPPQNAPPMTGPPSQYESFSHQNGRQHSRGGFHNNSRGGRPHQFGGGGGGDKSRHNHNFKKPGGAVPNPHVQSHQKPDAASAGKKKKRKTNTLGLTPGEDSDDDEIDEEAKLLELIGPDAINPTDIAAWIEERRQNFPTKARIKAKHAQAANPDKTKTDMGKDAAAAALERQQQKAEKLRRQLEKVESSIKRKREQQDEGDEMRDVDDASLSVSSDSKSDDEAPEALPTRFEPNPHLPPPPKKADPSKHCKYFSTGGTCGKKGKCRFVHDQSVREAALKERERNGGRMTLQQRLTLNDKEQEDLTIVKTLQYLKEKGAMGEVKTEDGEDATPQPTSVSYLPPPPIKVEGHHSLPPQPPPSVMSNSQTVRYQGWNLSGFGNTGVKSGDL